MKLAACGFGFSAFALDGNADPKLYGSGLNTDSQIGKHVIRAGHPLEIVYFPQPIHLPFKNGKKAKIHKLAAGRAHLLVLTTEGLFLLGNNAYGQCAREIVENENYFHSNYINHIAKIDGKTIIDIECGQDHSLAITEDGSVYSCGWGADGQTGLDTFKNTAEFKKVEGDISSERIIKVASRSDFVLALSDKGEVFGWGNAEYSQIKTSESQQQVSRPTYLPQLKTLGKIADVAAGGSICLVLGEDGNVFTWGFGLLGVGPEVQQSSKPLLIPQTLFGRNDFQPSARVVGLTCGLNCAMAVTNLGDLYSWGRNLRCSLGLGSDKDQYFPFKISMGGAVQKVFCGYDHAIAVCKPFI